MRDCHVYILYVLTNGAPWPSGWLPEVAVHQTWPRGQPRNRRLKDPDDVGAVLDPFPYIARIIFRTVAVSQIRVGHDPANLRSSPRASRLAPFFVKLAEARGDPPTR